jgi:O-antigen/teichoic acid export membrane protein
MKDFGNLTVNQLIKKLFFNAGLYGVGLFLTKGGSLLLMPLYWIKLSPEDFGVIGIAQIVLGFLAPLLDFGISGTILRFYYSWEDAERPKYFGALFLFSITFSLAICLAFEATGTWFFSSVIEKVPYVPLLRIMVWTAFLSNVANFPIALYRSREEPNKYSFMSVGLFLSQAAFTVLFIFYFQWGAMGYLLGGLCGYLAWLPYFLNFIFREIHFVFTMRYLKEPLRFAFPLMPSALIEGINGTVDRFFLDKFATLHSIGLYTLGRQFGAGFNVFTQVMKNSWVPLTYRIVTQRNDSPEVLARLASYYFAAMIFPALLVASLSKELIELLNFERYLGVYPFIPAFVFAFFFQGMGYIFGRGLDLAKKTHLQPIVALFGLTANLASLYFLVPKYGVWGAVYAFILATAFREFLLIGLSMYHYPRPTYWNHVAVISVSAPAIFWLASLLTLDNLLFRAFAKTLLISIGFAGVCVYILGKENMTSLTKRFRGNRK